jgi:hypothetical protein
MSCTPAGLNSKPRACKHLLSAAVFVADRHCRYVWMPMVTRNGTVLTLPFTANASCSFTPATLALAGGKAANFTVTITTEAPQAAELLGNFGAGLAGILLLFPWWKRRGVATRFVFSVLLFLTAGLSGCGAAAPAQRRRHRLPLHRALIPSRWSRPMAQRRRRCRSHWLSCRAPASTLAALESAPELGGSPLL